MVNDFISDLPFKMVCKQRIEHACTQALQREILFGVFFFALYIQKPVNQGSKHFQNVPRVRYLVECDTTDVPLGGAVILATKLFQTKMPCESSYMYLEIASLFIVICSLNLFKLNMVS